jgi:hypothetical protein
MLSAVTTYLPKLIAAALGISLAYLAALACGSPLPFGLFR